MVIDHGTVAASSGRDTRIVRSPLLADDSRLLLTSSSHHTCLPSCRVNANAASCAHTFPAGRPAGVLSLLRRRKTLGVVLIVGSTVAVSALPMLSMGPQVRESSRAAIFFRNHTSITTSRRRFPTRCAFWVL